MMGVKIKDNTEAVDVQNVLKINKMKRFLRFIYWLFVGRIAQETKHAQDPIELLNIIYPGNNIEDNHIKRK